MGMQIVVRKTVRLEGVGNMAKRAGVCPSHLTSGESWEDVESGLLDAVLDRIGKEEG